MEWASQLDRECMCVCFPMATDPLSKVGRGGLEGP